SLTSLSGKATTGEVTFADDNTAGSLTSSVVNNMGSVLPETGGIGTTIFYVLGGLMAVGAGVLLVAKKRMDA
ncbi:MAG: LPXTG cell wall anchor domain-containing protein, partial [Clostridia bacterium]|nr:LPXTG cell wall anchor domain-containing protein [Clostridia bacterium]